MTARCYVSVHSVSHMSRLCQRRQKAETQSLPCSTRCPQVQSLGNMFSWSRESVFFENVVCGLVWTASPSGRVCIFPQSWLKRPVIRLNGNKQNTQPVGPVQPKVPRGGFCPLLLSAGELRKRLWGPGRFVCTDFTICMFSFFFFLPSLPWLRRTPLWVDDEFLWRALGFYWKQRPGRREDALIGAAMCFLLSQSETCGKRTKQNNVSALRLWFIDVFMNSWMCVHHRCSPWRTLKRNQWANECFPFFFFTLRNVKNAKIM